MTRDTTVQFRMDSAIKDAAFSVFREMGITPSEAVRVFFTQVQKTRTLPFVVVADPEATSALEPGYAKWLHARLADTVGKLDRGEMQSHPSEQARAILKEKIALRRKTLKPHTP